MKRFRALAALLGCLAVLAGGFMTVVAAAASPSLPLTEQSAIGEPSCDHCENCGSVPCPASTTTCVPACASVAPSLAAAAFRQPAIEANYTSWSPRTPILVGLSPLPDPLPPRA